MIYPHGQGGPYIYSVWRASGFGGGGQVKLLSTCPPGRWLKKIMSYPVGATHKDIKFKYGLNIPHLTFYFLIFFLQNVPELSFMAEKSSHCMTFHTTTWQSFVLSHKDDIITQPKFVTVATP